MKNPVYDKPTPETKSLILSELLVGENIPIEDFPPKDTQMVMRGGDWEEPEKPYSRVQHRAKIERWFFDRVVGFRLVRSKKNEKSS